MASGQTPFYSIPFPLQSDVVDVAADMQDMASTIDTLLNENVGAAFVDNVLYVSKSGSDSNDGKNLGNSFLTIKAALAVATAGTTVFVKSGDYTENNPVNIPARVAVVGDSLRTVTVRPQNVTQDIFYVNNGCYVTGITFRDHVNPSAAFSFNPNGSAGFITTSPYIQNCSSITTTGKGMYINGAFADGLKSMVSDSYTQFNQGGMGIHIDNGGYAQLVSIFTICCNYAILCTNGGSCSLTNSNSSFGTYGLVADGVSSLVDSGFSDGSNQSGNIIRIKSLNTIPAVNDVISFDGGNTFFTITSASAISSGRYDVEFLETINPINPIANNTTANLYKRSFIAASSHTFEYVGSGNELFSALPAAGGIPIQENEVVELNGGNVFFTSTDQRGDFRIGGDLTINRADGTITGRTFNRSLFAVLTPYILAIEG
jgi:hypothetical protein